MVPLTIDPALNSRNLESIRSFSSVLVGAVSVALMVWFGVRLGVRFPSDIAPDKDFPQAPGLQPPAGERKTEGETRHRNPRGKAKEGKIPQYPPVTKFHETAKTRQRFGTNQILSGTQSCKK